MEVVAEVTLTHRALVPVAAAETVLAAVTILLGAAGRHQRRVEAGLEHPPR